MTLQSKILNVFILVICLFHFEYAFSQQPRFAVSADLVKNDSRNKELMFNVSIKNLSQVSIIVKRRPFVGCDKYGEVDIGFEIRKIEKADTVDWQKNCADMDIGLLLPLKKYRYDTLAPTASKLVVADIFNDVDWRRGDYIIRFIFYPGEELFDRKEKSYSGWVPFKIL